jgi:UDP-N-acetylglucosamine--N-acetylmuramyl-(pentapeptide) pyrophosphoryl-undecaprenol N-acetylglucosamine transferase
MRVMISGGGTAGHVNPAIALAQALDGDDVVFVGTEQGAESTLIPAAGFPLETIDVRGFDRSRPASIFGTAVRALSAVVQTRGLIRRLTPRVVVGMGGYVSLPVCTAARLSGRPIVLHEQNIVFGLANKVCKPFARAVAVSFEETLDDAGRRGRFVGNPVSAELVEADVDEARARAMDRFRLEPNRKTLLVFGGSQGARRVNEAALGLRSLWADRSDLQVVHILGRTESRSAVLDETGSTEGLIYRAVAFVERMVEAYTVADLALCRGGATTLAELAVVGLPSIVVPYPFHRDRQQERQGRIFERAGASLVLVDREATADRVASEADALLSDRSRIVQMSKAASALGRPDAATRLASVVREVAAA